MKLSKRITQIAPSATLAITSKAKAMKKEGIDVVSFGAGEPDFDTPDYIKESATNAIKRGVTKYTPSIGTVELRQAICAKLKALYGLEYKPSEIIVSNGAKHSLYNIFQAICDEGDEVIIASPYWVSYPEMVKLSGAKPIITATTSKNGFKMNPQQIEKLITNRTKALILNSPSNPTGSVYGKDELKAILEVIEDKDIRVISDEIYDRLVYDNIEYTSFPALSEKSKAITILVNGVSKTYSMTGWRIGYLASTDADFLKCVNNLQDHSTSNPSSISQEAALSAVKNEDASLENMKREFEKRRNYMVERLNSIKGFSCIKPQGAFYCFVDVSGLNKNSLAFAEKLLEEAKVAVIPGEGFGAPGFIRLSFAIGMENIKKGLDRISEWVRQ